MQNSAYQTNLTCTEMWTQQIHNFLHVSALLECQRQGVLISVTVVRFEFVHNVRHSHSLTQPLTNKVTH
jgi:hypothetical protein